MTTNEAHALVWKRIVNDHPIGRIHLFCRKCLWWFFSGSWPKATSHMERILETL